MLFLSLFSLTSLSQLQVVALSFSVPPQWINTTSELSKGDRIEIAQQVVDTLKPLTSPTTLSIQHAIATLTLYDYFTGGRENYEIVVDNLRQATATFLPTLPSGYSMDVPIEWGITAMYAYKTYQEQTFLHTAMTTWDVTGSLFITADDVRAGQHPSKNGSIVCTNTSLVGGVFTTTNPQDLRIKSGASSAYMILSVYLFEATSNMTYLNAAKLSHQFMESNLYNNNTGITMDIFSVASCSVANPNAIFSYNTAFHLEGVSALANASRDPVLAEFADMLSVRAMSTQNWVAPNGTIIEVDDNHQIDPSDKGLLIRALFEHRSRMSQDLDLAKTIEGFINVQYNALLNVARIPNSSWYSIAWGGPRVLSTLPSSQLAALDVFNAEIGLSSQTLENSTSILPFPTTLGGTPINQGPIIGSSVGGGIFICILALGAVLILRRHRRKARRRMAQTLEWAATKSHNDTPQDPDPTITPFSLQMASAVIPLKLRFETQPTGEDQTEIAVDAPSSPTSSSQESVRDLLNRLNRAMSRLPQNINDTSTELPQYRSVI